MRKSHLPLILSCIVVLSCPLLAAASTPDTQPATQPSEKERDIRKLLEVSGSGKLGAQVAKQMLTQFRQIFPQVPPEFWDQAANEISADELVDLIVPVYDRHFTDEDIKGLISFYQSPLGKKLVDQLPQISAESMAVGQEWGKALGARLVERLKKGGYLKT